MIARALALLGTVALASACRVGDPLVDRARPPSQGPLEVASCAMPEDCSNPLVLNLPFPVATPLDWQSCPEACGAIAGEPPTGSDAELGDAGLPFDCAPLAPLDELDRELSCVTKRFAGHADAPALAAGEDVLAQRVRWQRSNVVLEADEPLELVISSGEIANTRLHLSGPIALRFEGGIALSGVSISGASSAASVTFDGVDPTELIVGDDAAPFAGEVVARHGTLTNASVVAESVVLDAAAVDSAFISARILVANDGSLRGATLDVGDATFAPTMLDLVAIERCRTLSFFGSTLSGVLVPRCSGEPTRIFASDVLYSRLDGRILGDSGKLEHVQLGLNDPSELELWGMTVAASSFCDNVERLEVSANAVRCSVCSDAALEPLATACALPEGDFAPIAAAAGDQDGGMRTNYCQPLDELQACDSSKKRPRPVDER